MIYTVTLNPALDKTVTVPGFAKDAVNRIAAVQCDPGGKGLNVSKVVASLSGQSRAFALLGGSTGERIAAAIAALGIPLESVQVPGETRTNLKIVDPAEHTNTDLNEPGPAVSAAAVRTLLERLLAAIKKDDIVVLAGSLPAGCPETLYRDWITACRAAGARVFLDADRAMLASGVTAAPYLIKPNTTELGALLGQTPGTVVETARAARQLARGGIAQVVVSMGADGALFVTEHQALRAKGLHVKVGSTVGAGDSMVAALAVGAERGMSLAETARLAMAASAANVMCSGTQAAEWSAIEALLPQVELETLSL